jgi:hypothetical protein
MIGTGTTSFYYGSDDEAPLPREVYRCCDAHPGRRAERRDIEQESLAGDMLCPALGRVGCLLGYAEASVRCVASCASRRSSFLLLLSSFPSAALQGAE